MGYRISVQVLITTLLSVHIFLLILKGINTKNDSKWISNYTVHCYVVKIKNNKILFCINIKKKNKPKGSFVKSRNLHRTSQTMRFVHCAFNRSYLWLKCILLKADWPIRDMYYIIIDIFQKWQRVKKIVV